MMLGRSLPPALFSLLLAAARAAATPYDFKDNYHDPAPSPEDGPPASFYTTRDRQRLPYEICGLVGGYVLTVLIWGVLLLTLGRKMRRKALDPPPALEWEQELKPIRGVMDTPISPGSVRSATSWMRRFKRPESLSGSTPVSPVVQSPMSFDQQVLNADRARAQDDMERLYAAVMDHDAKKHSRQASREVDEHMAPPVARSERRRPSAISTTLRAPTDSSPVSPVKAIYPPDYNNASAHSRNSSLRTELSPPSPPSILAKPRRLSSASRQDKSARFNLKNLRISGPIQSYGGAAPDDEARTPLSPRFYPNPGAPPSPPTQPTSPTTPYSPTEPAEIQRAHSLRIPLPHPAPRRGPSMTIAPPSPLHLHTTRSPTMTPTTQLPFRSYQTSDAPLQSPGIQTTVLDRRPDKLSLQTPRTGVPFTPYSPYMPFTPITPVTPHLVTKRERKGKRKEGGRLRRVPEVELVKSPEEMFGDAY
ncbi:uncharacterized protein EKO05_0005708 [Ascochyta rabiei]|uniref:Uncharacterized protein n=1 Tax=Didymella rabiei TaxID=5454 RepID=A0A163EJL1_DIDRA|nr:uncharacterized protein EKO05_0005708 [Ascochyta rabiei]KZM23723.1 hypothetical protein ST47_g5141 [Ascochyta rabiei]UPX15253.1 hypothetical protein EKO05_0005708 [Ascochyta rabiei]